MKYVKFLMLTAVLSLSGCKMWNHIKTPTTEMVYNSISVELPVGWMHFTPPESLMITKDGMGVQTIMVEKKEHKDAFDSIEKASSPDMNVNEAVDLLISDFKKANEDVTMSVVHKKPYQFSDGTKGFEVELEVKTKKGLVRKSRVNGFIAQDGLVLFSFHSPKLHYFERDITVYEELVNSAKIG